MSVIDDYLKSVEADQRKELERIRMFVKQTVPEAEETISYGMPAFRYKTKPLFYFGAFKDHMSVFPASGSVIGELQGKLEKFRTSKGTLQFTLDNPIPNELVKEMLQNRIKAIDGK